MKNYRYLERRNMMIRRIGLWVGEIVAAILLAFLVIQFCFQTVTVHGDSMQPAYYDGDDEYFVMGDNCNNSEDSRVSNIGNIKRSQFVGKIAGTLHKVTRQ